ncbi:cystathionine gamma-synthase [Mycetocola sp. BIGb0189]|uniref:cystathionine gamma-synthase n=1 Tax=Mycetocola sp. BIGb0189 TaxID=2940604 RepID=UPI0021680075|nr:cystathionine gamma-synthase [Mycetocola sp. BIGb0189]MCS4276311.1 cystathionine gamma-synthase [Mycetocola sp. BIGb0189]
MTHSEGFATRAIHAGQEFDPTTGAVIPPLYLTSTFVQARMGQLRGGYEYSRGGNPTRTSLETQMAALDNAKHAITFSSGLAAEDGLLRAILRPGDHVVIGNDAYGGSYRLISRIFGPWGITHTVVDLGDTAAVAAAITDNTKLLWVETPSNPLLAITDIAALAELAHAKDVRVLVDNTFATPVLQQPLALGADIVVYSTTKYIGGHSDVIGGAIVLNDDELAEAVRFQQFAVGAISAPLEAWLTTRGIKTLPLRMRQHGENAQAVAELLESRPEVERVYYPGLESHPGHELAKKQMSGFGGMVSFALRGGREAAIAFAESTELFQLAESLGGVESLMNYPALMTHASVAGTELAVPDNVLRLSVGVEDVADLLADLERAFERTAARLA